MKRELIEWGDENVGEYKLAVESSSGTGAAQIRGVGDILQK